MIKYFTYKYFKKVYHDHETHPQNRIKTNKYSVIKNPIKN